MQVGQLFLKEAQFGFERGTDTDLHQCMLKQPGAVRGCDGQSHEKRVHLKVSEIQQGPARVQTNSASKCAIL